MSVARYQHSVEPVYTDGRDIDLDVGELTGEAGNQKSSGSSDIHIQKLAQTWKQLPEPQTSDPTYYDRPMLQESIWGWAIPTYYYVGGLTGASLALGAAVMLRRDPELETLVDRCHLMGFIGATISGGLLVYDLGRPGRFLNMLRVFRPTSPMNMGAWILSATAATATGAVLLTTAAFQIPPLTWYRLRICRRGFRFGARHLHGRAGCQHCRPALAGVA